MFSCSQEREAFQVWVLNSYPNLSIGKYSCQLRIFLDTRSFSGDCLLYLRRMQQGWQDLFYKGIAN